MLINRDDVELEDRWNVEHLFPDWESWQKSLKEIIPTESRPLWPQFLAFKGKLHESPAILKKALDEIFHVERNLSSLFTYAHLRHDEDIAQDSHKAFYNQITNYLHEFMQEVSWVEPELLAISPQTFKTMLTTEELAPYRFHLEKILRLKQHTLPEENEKLMALSLQALMVSHKAFSAITDADFSFGSVLDKENKEQILTHAQYGVYLRSQDRTLRKNAFVQYHQQYKKYENTLAELLNGQIQGHIFNARARKYSSSLEASLYPKNIETSVYHALIQAVNEKIDVLHKYINLRKKILHLPELHLYDVYVPLTPNVEIKMTYPEAEDLVIESVAPLGKEYQNQLQKGFKEERWVDRYENLNKRSGAYSSGCYDSVPYILMNYKGQIRDVFTLAHEAGHSMHSFLSRKNQPFQYADYPIFLAEVASTFNEDLLFNTLLKRVKKPEEKIFLINQKIEDIRGTLFRQTMFAEFELWIHTQAEKNLPLTPKTLKDFYHAINEKYFGSSAHIDEEIDIEWARIPHFYYNFYVYQYSTGISAALALSERVNQGDTAERNDYLQFLKAGCSRYPIDILKSAGVDMTTPIPVLSAINKFEALVDELEILLGKNTKN